MSSEVVQFRRSKVPVTISDSFVSLGWWMVMTEDEQGYAPAAYLDTLEESTLDRYPENATNEGVCVCVCMCAFVCIFI